jgi:hypothetical protein
LLRIELAPAALGSNLSFIVGASNPSGRIKQKTPHEAGLFV